MTFCALNKTIWPYLPLAHCCVEQHCSLISRERAAWPDAWREAASNIRCRVRVTERAGSKERSGPLLAGQYHTFTGL